MKAYTVSIDIELPRERVIELFDDPDNLVKWQPGLLSFERISGEPGQPGARSKLTYQHGKRTMDLIEVLEVRKLPEEFHGRYEWPGGRATGTGRSRALSPPLRRRARCRDRNP